MGGGEEREDGKGRGRKGGEKERMGRVEGGEERERMGRVEE